MYQNKHFSPTVTKPGKGKRLFKFSSLLLVAPSLALMMSCEPLNQEELVNPAVQANQPAKNQLKTGMADINILLNRPLTEEILQELGKYGAVKDLLPEIQALTMKVKGENLSAIQKLSYVDTANPDAVRYGAPIDGVAATDFSEGINTWNLDAVNVTDLGQSRTIEQDATGVFVGVLDTGLLDSWRMYFPEERIASQYAKSFGGGGGENGNVSEQPNKWEHDQNSHGTHVTSSIIGFNLRGTAINGVAPKATIIPIKVLNQNGSGTSSVVARGIMYMAELKEGPLKDSPVVVNMSLGGPVLDAIEKAAIDYAISKGVIIVASAGNSGMAGMGYPGAYEPVISVASAGLVDEFTVRGWWNALDVSEPTDPAEFYVSDFSSRAKPGQDLDVIAPGSNVVGPFQVNSGQLSYYYLSGTSMASPHVAGIVALMAQQKPSLKAGEVELILESAAIPMATPEEAGAGFITADAALFGLSL